MCGTAYQEGVKYPVIPPGQYNYKTKAYFVSYPKPEIFSFGFKPNWHVWGPDTIVIPGEVVAVFRHSENEDKQVQILDIVAHRLVKKRDGSTVRFVMATFDNILEEEE